MSQPYHVQTPTSAGYRCASCGGFVSTAAHSCGSAPIGVATAEAVWHRHVWRYDGQLADGRLVYHCDHEPPVVAVVAAEAWQEQR